MLRRKLEPFLIYLKVLKSPQLGPRDDNGAVVASPWLRTIYGAVTCGHPSFSARLKSHRFLWLKRLEPAGDAAGKRNVR